MGTALLHADRQTDRRTDRYDDARRRCCLLMWRCLTRTETSFSHYFSFHPSEPRFPKFFVHPQLLLGAFAKFRKGTICFIMSVRPSARNNSPHIVRIFTSIFRKCIASTQVSLKERKKEKKNNGYFTSRLICT